MTLLSGLGIVLSLVFGCLLLALVAELYYLLWWKRQRIGSSSNRIEDDYSNHTKEMFYLFCWDKPSSMAHNPNPSTIVANPSVNQHDPDVELGLGASKDLLLKALGEEGVEAELMRLHNLAGPPRFLFTIKEETKEDLESDDGRSKCGDRSKRASRTKSLSDLIVALDSHTPYLSPMASPMKCSLDLPNINTSNNYNNPLFESSVEAELFRLRSSPPPKFKFLRDAEEKLYRRLLEEAQKSGILHEIIMENSHPNPPLEGEKDGSLMKESKSLSNNNNNGGKNKEREGIHCTSQVLPLASSPPAVESKPSLH